MKRRTFFLSAVVAGVAGALLLKPKDKGAAYTEYFEQLNRELKRSGAYRPTLLIDLDILDRNINRLNELVKNQANYRIPVKSVPSLGLVEYIMNGAGTKSLMLFHQPFINEIARSIPDADVLMGKPMPVKAVENFYSELEEDSTFDPERQLQWLVDSPERLSRYRDLAVAKNLKLRINCELDVGLHRGGLTDPSQLEEILQIIDGSNGHLEFAGLMGYDPHVVKLPEMVKTAQEAYDESQAIYQSYIDRLMELRPDTDLQSLTLNGAGSPSLELHCQKTICNDITTGSALVKPTDFDIPSLASMEASSFIATPVIKQWDGVKIPSLEKFSGAMGKWNPNQKRTFVIYGGKWMADYTEPKGLAVNDLFGTSTNQQVLNGSDKIELSVGDHVFLRPHQSEFVFLQFGDIQTLRGGRLSDKWSVFSNAERMG